MLQWLNSRSSQISEARCAASDTQAKPYRTDYVCEIKLTRVCLGLTVCLWLIATCELTAMLVDRIHSATVLHIMEQVLFILIVQGLMYGNFIYQLTRLGYLRRRLAHNPLSNREREKLYDGEAPTLTILVPSYKEEAVIVRRTLISAALQDYPHRRVVLLIDDPIQPENARDMKALNAMRGITSSLQDIFDLARAPFLKAEQEFNTRFDRGNVSARAETVLLAQLYNQAASWLDHFAQKQSLLDPEHQILTEKVLACSAACHRERARAMLDLGVAVPLPRIRREYRRLAALFSVEFASFERKAYVNLSHEPNKAMNLNSYIRLLGHSWQSVVRDAEKYLEEATVGVDSFHVPAADFLITLDADSLITPEYALVLINEMLRPGNERLAVAQTPYNTIPNPVTLLERIAGATTDIQYLIHQGFTWHQATYWVGANALLRTTALNDIKQTIKERGFDMPVYIQDRTVIEDTESSVDLIARGWRLSNYPERLAFSATPPDFGSLLIQRRRWANGGLIILPKLLRHVFVRPNLAKFREGFFRIHYLSSITFVNIGLIFLIGHSFESCIKGPWLALIAVPYFYLYARDLRYNKYRTRDLCAVYSLNLLLIPVNLGGVFKSLEQALTGSRIPFGRTPKILGRTGIPTAYCLAELFILLFFFVAFSVDIWHQRWTHAVFCLVSGALFNYGLIYLIGLNNLLSDLRAGMMLRVRREPFAKSGAISSHLEPDLAADALSVLPEKKYAA